MAKARLTRAMFYTNTSGRGVGVSAHQALLASKRAHPQGEGYAFKEYRIHRAMHSRNPATHEALVVDHGRVVITAVYEGEVVGVIRRDFMWVHPDHRGKGLAPEMSIDFLLAMGCAQWSVEEWQNWLDTPTFAEGGYHNRTKMFDMLVERGIVESAE